MSISVKRTPTHEGILVWLEQKALEYSPDKITLQSVKSYTDENGDIGVLFYYKIGTDFFLIEESWDSAQDEGETVWEVADFLICKLIQQ